MLRQFTSLATFRAYSLGMAAIVASALCAPARLMAQEPAADGNALTHESLKERLVGLGYEPKTEESTAGTPIYVLDFQHSSVL